MNKQLQDLAWSVLPKEFKEEVKILYNHNPGAKPMPENTSRGKSILRDIFGHDNLTSDAEGENKTVNHDRRYWTEEDIKFLIENYDKMTDEEIAVKFGRTSRAINIKRHKMGLKKDYEMPVLNKKVCGVGNCDVRDIRFNGNVDVYQAWRGMLDRCYNSNPNKYPSYKGCSVCEEWLTFSTFRDWFYNPINGYKKGYHLDKDILVRGNKVYSPDTCCFVPKEINSMFTKPNMTFSDTRVRQFYRRFYALIKIRGEIRYLGSYLTQKEAEEAYKHAKEEHIHSLGEEYYTKGDITERVYNAMLNFRMA